MGAVDFFLSQGVAVCKILHFDAVAGFKRPDWSGSISPLSRRWKRRAIVSRPCGALISRSRSTAAKEFL